MENGTLVIGDVKIEKGATATIHIPLPKLYHTPTNLLVNVIRGKKDGPTVFISAAIHGDELNGIEIIRRLKKLSILKKIQGTLILVPVVNIYGMMNLSRYMPDRRDLNRSFPGTSKGSLAARIAKIFFDEVVSKCSLGIDLHTGAIHRTNLPQVRTNLDSEYTKTMAKVFEAPVILHSELRDGSLRGEAQANGVPILLYEAGEALRFDESSIRIGVQGIINVLRENGNLPKTKTIKKKKTPIITRQSKWVRASSSGVLRTVKRLGDTVEYDEVIAYIDDPFSGDAVEITAPFVGVIIGKLQIPLAQEGDAVFHIANISNPGLAENKIGYFSENAIEQSEFIELHNEETIE